MLKIENLSFAYDREHMIFTGFDLELKKSETVAVMGPSGCGKSTLLGLVSGFLTPTDGRITCNAHRISYAFQEPRLFPWLTVEENLKAVLPKEAPASQITEMLAFMDLGGTETLYPDELSGGMKSRVSLARALLYGGDLFLLDEPFSALDRELCTSLSQKLRRHLDSIGASAIFVTHRREDAEILASRIIEISPVS